MNHLMNEGWSAAHTTELDGWLIRRTSGITLRANSVLPQQVPHDVSRALDYVESLYAAHNITPSFQISPAAQPVDLDAHLAARGYTVQNPTLVQCADLTEVLRRLPPPSHPVNISTTPSVGWTTFWSQSSPIAHQILTRTQALYATVSPAPGGDPSSFHVRAIGRLALVEDSAGLYCLSVDENFRRQGLAQTIIHGLLQAATTRGVKWAWLSVLADNTPAIALYRRLGFRTVSKYHYRVKA
jgi:GNAT superfamily N-acetyltransferase